MDGDLLAYDAAARPHEQAAEVQSSLPVTSEQLVGDQHADAAVDAGIHDDGAVKGTVAHDDAGDAGSAGC
ncbi:MAG TPA: hypothetical protein VKG45_16875 [Actinomycetes bacterium]|nr:hypothetical protein [Actinomycetes bacterium]